MFRRVASVSLFILLVAALAAQAQTFTVLHSFNGSDGSYPTSTLILDRAGNLYGTTEYRGVRGQGVVFQLKHTSSGTWIYAPVHQFTGFSGTGDGAYPLDYGGLTLALDGTIYGTAENGGVFGCDGESYCGTVFRLQPPPSACTVALCSWLLTNIYEFNPHSGAEFPVSNVVFDNAGNLYGTTQYSSIFELSPSGGSWTQSDYDTGFSFTAGVVLDSAGNLYGVTPYGGSHGDGIVFELSPSPSGWTENRALLLYQWRRWSASVGRLDLR